MFLKVNGLTTLDDGELPLPYKKEYRPVTEFNYDGGKEKLVNLPIFANETAELRFLVPGEPSSFDENESLEDFGHSSKQGKIHRLSTWLNLENKVSIGCAGAVIAYLSRKRAQEHLQNDPAAQQAYRVSSMEMFTLKQTMCVDSRLDFSRLMIFPGWLMLTPWPLCKSCSPNHIRMRSIKGPEPQAPKSLYLYMACFITSQEHHRAR